MRQKMPPNPHTSPERYCTKETRDPKGPSSGLSHWRCAGLATVLQSWRARPSFVLFRKQPRHPPRGECRRKRETQGGTGALGDEHPALEQGCGDPAGLTVAHTEEACHITARHGTTEQDRFENGPRVGR